MRSQASSHPTPEQLTDLVLAEVAPAQAEGIYRHLADCPSCDARWRQLQEAAQRIRAAGPPPRTPPAAVGKRLRARAGADARWHRLWERLGPGAVGLAAGAALIWGLGGAPSFGPTSLGAPVARLAGRGASRGAVYLNAALDRVTLEVTGLPPLAGGRVYEVWWVRGTLHLPGGTFGVDRRGDAAITLVLPKGWKAAAALGITAEPAPGTSAPTGPRVLGGALHRP